MAAVRGWEALAGAANAILKTTVAMPAGAAGSEVGGQPSLLRGRVFCEFLHTDCLVPNWESSLPQPQLPLLGKCAFAKQKVSVTGVLNESSLPTASERSRRGWRICERVAASACSDPQLSPRTWASSSNPADPCLEERGKCCFALPQPASEQPRAVCKHKMGSALLVVLFLLCQDRRI